MNLHETQELSIEDLKPLKHEYLKRKRGLESARGKAKKKELQERLDALRMDLGWTLMDYGKYEEGLALYRLLSWTTHGEIKCNGMARALTEMKCYDEARRLLETGLRRFPNSYQLWVGLGVLNDSLGNHFEALKCSDMAIQCVPEGSWEPQKRIT
jgi:tetratricopeptide (TPR) repeat protein